MLLKMLVGGAGSSGPASFRKEERAYEILGFTVPAALPFVRRNFIVKRRQGSPGLLWKAALGAGTAV